MTIRECIASCYISPYARPPLRPPLVASAPMGTMVDPLHIGHSRRLSNLVGLSTLLAKPPDPVGLDVGVGVGLCGRWAICISQSCKTDRCRAVISPQCHCHQICQKGTKKNNAISEASYHIPLLYSSYWSMSRDSWCFCSLKIFESAKTKPPFLIWRRSEHHLKAHHDRSF